jgi:hypothetical protein
LTDAETALALAVAALALAGVLLLAVLFLALRLRRIRRAQRLVLGGREQDLVEYAVALLARVERVEGRAETIETLMRDARRELDGCLQRIALVRYDALEGAGGKQSTSIALLDTSGSGVILSAIQGRDYARIYIKELHEGESDLDLSPEELRAVRAAATS